MVDGSWSTIDNRGLRLYSTGLYVRAAASNGKPNNNHIMGDKKTSLYSW